MWGIPYDDVDGWRGPYPPEVLATQFEKIADWLATGHRRTDIGRCEDAGGSEKRGASGLAVRLRRGDSLSVGGESDSLCASATTSPMPHRSLSSDERAQLQLQIRQLLESEIGLAKELFTLTRDDSRIGFEPSCQYFYLPLDLVEKVVNCRWLLEHLEEWAGAKHDER